MFRPKMEEYFNNPLYNISYRQDANGQRVQKHITTKSTNTTESHYYDYNGTQLICERRGDNTLCYMYDESGNPVGITYNGTEYYYITNLQGDVIGIVNAVLECEKVEGLAMDTNGNGIRLLITDHLDWKDEYNHLLILQEKINSYIIFCEKQQYRDVYKDISVEYAIFEIHFKFEPTNNAMNF